MKSKTQLISKRIEIRIQNDEKEEGIDTILKLLKIFK